MGLQVDDLQAFFFVSGTAWGCHLGSIDTPRLYRKRCGTYFLRVMVAAPSKLLDERAAEPLLAAQACLPCLREGSDHRPALPALGGLDHGGRGVGNLGVETAECPGIGAARGEDAHLPRHRPLSMAGDRRCQLGNLRPVLRGDGASGRRQNSRPRAIDPNAWRPRCSSNSRVRHTRITASRSPRPATIHWLPMPAAACATQGRRPTW